MFQFPAFNSLRQCINHFQTDQSCRSFLETAFWNNNPICPCCQTERPYRLANGKHFKCRNKECKKRFTVVTNTYFEHTHIELPTWFAAMYLMFGTKKGISSLQLSRDLAITQKSAWFLAHRIREMFLDDFEFDEDAIVEMDETYVSIEIVGERKKRNKQGRNNEGKMLIYGAVQRGATNKVKMAVRTDASSEKINEFIKDNIKPGTTMMTDGWRGYCDVKKTYEHHIVDHGKKEYARGIAHTNTVEGVWSILKRGIYGTYHKMTDKHLSRYVKEYQFRYNTRKENQNVRFQKALKNCFGHLSYKELTGK